MYYVYVLTNPLGRIYIGHSGGLQRRFNEHKTGMAAWTRYRGPWRLFGYETYATRAEAMKREKQLKSGRLNQELRRRVREGGSIVERVLPGKD